MAFDPISAGIGAVGSIFGAISQRKAQKAAARDAKALAEYENATNLQNWEYAKKERDFEFNQALRIYDKSKDVYGQQLTYNREAASRSYEAENRKMDEYLQGLSFQKQDSFIQMLQARGKADSRGVAGRSSQRLANDVLSQFGRNNAVLAENLVSSKRQADIDLQNIGLQKTGADLAAYERLGLEPVKGPEPPKPLQKPVAGGSANPLLSIGSSLISGLAQGYYRK
jgi:hypothetical protein